MDNRRTWAEAVEPTVKAPGRLRCLVSNGNGSQVKVDLWKVIQLLANIALVVGMPLVGWLCIEVATMAGNRFTSQDGAALYQQIDTRLDAIEKEIASLPKEVPPQSVLDTLDRHEEELHDLRALFNERR